ncbi:MAG TPA: hypoxanthine phosphoribosyltransferase [Phycisphaerae bacterium]|nr:hypoxanthine phosphoribosyltransferase [Phycisphaerae bacterium]HNU45480.1 hypoxanthine phosphoribosyltransferase [Phycisphaerae bacterium]
MNGDIDRVLITEAQIAARIRELAGEIGTAYPEPADGIVIVPVLSGSVFFLVDLVRLLPMKMRIGMVAVSSYPGEATRSQGAKLVSGRFPDVRDRHVLLVDDILDSGGTLRLVRSVMERAGARSIKTAVLLRKVSRAPVDVPADFVGFDIEDRFVVGYGLDYNDYYRNLPYIAVLRPELYKVAESCPV